MSRELDVVTAFRVTTCATGLPLAHRTHSAYNMQHTMSQGLSGTLCTRRIPRPSVVLLPKRSSSASTAPSSKLVTVRASNDDEVFKERKFKDFALRSREAVLRAVEELGNSATAAEVASKAALPVQEAEQCLQALAIDGSGSLKVHSVKL